MSASSRQRPATTTSSPAKTLRIVVGREGLNHLRDRRSVFGALLFPILGPLVLVSAIRFAVRSERATELPVHVYGALHAPALVDDLRARNLDVLTLEGGQKEAERAVSEQDVHVALVIPSGYMEQLRDGKMASMMVVLDSSRPKTLGLARRLEGALGATLQTLGALRLMARGVAPVVAHPARIESIDLATPEQAAAKLLYVIPMMLILSAFGGGMNIAIDTTAGERERKSLEPLLLTPASRFGVVAGKWLTATLAALAVCLVGAVLFALVPPLLPLEELGLRMEFGWTSALHAWLWVAPLAGLGVALEMLIASFARTFKEAQTYLSLFLLVPTLPSVFLVYTPLDNTPWASLVPALAQITAVMSVLKAEPPPLQHLALAWVSCAGYTSLVLLGLERLWRRESIVFGR